MQNLLLLQEKLLQRAVNEIVPGVFLSDMHSSYRYDYLQKLGIQQILTVGSELRSHDTPAFETLYIDIEDDTNAEIHHHFERASAFIHQAPTLVHCFMGMSDPRLWSSPTSSNIVA